MLTITENPGEVDWANIPKDKLLNGNALDSFITYGLIDQIKIDSWSNQVAVLLSKCVPVFSELEYNGLDINEEKLRLILANLVEEIEELMDGLAGIEMIEDFKTLSELEVFNIRSSKQLNEFFKYAAGVIKIPDLLDLAGVEKSVKTGLYSFNEANLKKFKAWMENASDVTYSGHRIQEALNSSDGILVREVVESILSLRGYCKLRDSYFGTSVEIIERIGSPKLYCQYNLTGTVTGRLSCEAMSFKNQKVGVSMHTLPRSERFNMRDVIVPSKNEREDGDLFITVDYSAMELRVLAQACKDMELCNAFQTGSDLHTVTASKIYGKDTSEVTSEERQVGKTTNFLTVYGGGPKRLAEVLGKPYDECKGIIRDYHKAFPGIDEFRGRVVSALRKDNFSVSLFGRTRHLVLPYKYVTDKFEKFRVERQAVNSIIQSSASDILLVALLNFNSFIKENELNGRIVATVHDSIEFVMSKEDFFGYFQEILDIFHAPDFEKAGLTELYTYGLGGNLTSASIAEDWVIPLEIDIEVGRSFGSNRAVKFDTNKDATKYTITNPDEIFKYIKEI